MKAGMRSVPSHAGPALRKEGCELFKGQGGLFPFRTDHHSLRPMGVIRNRHVLWAFQIKRRQRWKDKRVCVCHFPGSWAEQRPRAPWSGQMPSAPTPPPPGLPSHPLLPPPATGFAHSRLHSMPVAGNLTDGIREAKELCREQQHPSIH